MTQEVTARARHVAWTARVQRSRTVEWVGLALFGSAAAWAAVSQTSSGGDARPFIALLFAAGILLAAARWLAKRGRALPLVLTTAAALGVALSSPGSLWSRGALSNPLGYANAKGAFFALAAVGAIMLTLEVHGPVARGVCFAMAVFFASIPVASVSVASALLVLVLPLGALLATGLSRRATKTTITILELAFIAVLGVTAVVGVTGRGGLVGDALTKRRVQMWHQATTLMLRRPVTGVGPDRFREVSPIARRDPDFRWAHNEFLQQGAEQGVPGMLLLASLFLWALVGLHRFSSPGPIQALGAVAVTMLGVQASLLAAALVGASMARNPRRARQMLDREASLG
jgi:O-antigen ligase